MFLHQEISTFDQRNKLLRGRLNMNATIVLAVSVKDRQNENAANNGLMIYEAVKQTISLDVLSRYEKKNWC